MTHPRAPHPSPTTALLGGLDIAYDVAADPHWLTAGSTRHGGPSETPERRATRVDPAVPVNLATVDLGIAHETAQREYAALYGDTDRVPRMSRTELAAYAAGLGDDNPAARAAYELHQLLDGLRAALHIGDGNRAIGRISCPSCFCWSLSPIRAASGDGWRAACRNGRCATPDGPRTWGLRELAEHHLRDLAA